MIEPGATIGIIGGGQLGRMTALAAANLGYKTHIFTPEKDAPASQVATHTTIAEYTDAEALEAFAAKVDVITFEFENVPHESLEMIEKKRKVCPSASVLKICRNRLREKTFINELGIRTAFFKSVTSLSDLKLAAMAVRFPAVLKTAELGYDGKGQVTLKTGSDLRTIWETMQTHEAILESFVEFSREISVIVARGAHGQTRCYPAVQNIHKNHILDTTIVPAPIDKALAEEAEAIAVKIATVINLKGVLAVEMFVDDEGRLLVNELAPRPHNSGHWTIDASATSQFEQLVRAICDLPLGDTTRRCDAEMKNLIGDDVKNWKKFLTDKNARLHLYGKSEIRAGRKMGHVTFLKSAK